MARWRRAEERETPPGDDLRDVKAKARAGVAAHADRHRELVDIMRVLLRSGDYAKWSSLRRLLRLAGHAGTRTHGITLALLDAFPDACLDRVYDEDDQRPRVIRGVRLVADMETLRRKLAERWEAKLAGEGLPPEIQRIAQEYKLSPLSANDNHGGRLAHLVIRAHLRAQTASWYYGKATDYLWSMTSGWANWPGHKRVWALHCEGATKEEIAGETGLSETKVQSVLDYHRARAGLSQR